MTEVFVAFIGVGVFVSIAAFTIGLGNEAPSMIVVGYISSGITSFILMLVPLAVLSKVEALERRMDAMGRRGKVEATDQPAIPMKAVKRL